MVLGVAAPLALPASAGAAPFSFLLTPTEQLAVSGEVAGAQITPEGYVYTGWGELVFRVGPKLRAFDQRIRTLERGRYPVHTAKLRHGRITYTLRTFMAPVRGRPVVFVRATMRNGSRRTAIGRLAGGIRNASERSGPRGAPRFRYLRPAAPPRPGLYRQPGDSFSPSARYSVRGSSLIRDGRVLYVFPAGRRGVKRTVKLRDRRRGGVTRRTTFGLSDYRTRLAPGESVRLDFRMPVPPPEAGSALHGRVARASFDTHRRRTLAGWRKLFMTSAGVAIPERKVEDAYYANLANLVMTRYRDEDRRWVQTVNKLQYHAFWLRDAAVMTQALDLAGLHALAGQNLPFFLTWQQDDGLFISRPGQHDGFGQTLWAFGEHVARSGDLELGRRLFPSVQKAMAWFERARREDRLGLLPPGTPNDNELATGHITGDNFWAVAGVERAVTLARALGEPALADRWSAELAEYKATLAARVRAAAKRRGGWIPPALGTRGGQDWGNLWAAWPAGPFRADDPLVTRTLRHVRSEFREGIATYLDKRLLHHYLGFRVWQTELLRGEQRKVIDGLYAALAHTTSTHGGFETGIHPYGSRSVIDNMTPHGWFAAEYVALVRNMLVREEDEGLVLMSALSPAWLRPGKTVAMRYAPTTRGRMTFELRSVRGGATLRWQAEVPEGTRLRWPLPSGVTSVRAPGLARGERSLVLPRRSGTIRLRWKLRGGAAPTYERAVARLVREYRRRGR